MTNLKSKQLKIDRLFKKRTETNTEDCSELEEEIHQLELALKQKELELFEIKKQCLRRKHVPNKKRKTIEFVKPERILLENGIENMKKSLELYALLTGMEVRSYVQDDHCCVMYHMQHQSEHAHQHGLRISLASDENILDKISLPVGFNYKRILDDYDKISRPECLVAIRKGLVAFYDRQEQFIKLRELLSYNGQLFKKVDGSYIEMSTFLQSIEDLESDPVDVQIVFTYRIYDIRPKQYSLGKDVDISEVEKEKLDKQCSLFKQKPLDVAFKECFMDGNGPYKFNIDACLDEARKEYQREKRRQKQRLEQGYDVTFDPDESA